MKTRRPFFIRNWLGLFGAVVAAGGFFSAVCLLALDLFADRTHPYLGILTYLIAPAVMATGLALIVAGAWRERRRQRFAAPGETAGFPKIDLNDPRQRRRFMLATAGVFVFLMVSALGSYRTYHFTESVEFCGRVCHKVMEPEYTAYQHSPHARVACVQCHIGPGADWFVRSKLSGSYQVYATLANKFPRPIPRPIKNLRPAQDTCEQCHWPQKFFSSVERINTHFLADETNTPWTIQLLMKVGGGDPDQGPVSGIHWHVGGQQQIEYIATDAARQKIPWVRVTDLNGNVTVYEAKEDALKPDQVTTSAMRRMDCIDCHNQPSHIYRAPAALVNQAMATGRIPRTLPFIKKNAVEVLTAEYKTTEDALQTIAKKLPAPAVAETQRIYRQNFFPEMKVDWRTYPNNIGHTISTGCYRCHDGQHVNAKGKAIRHDCNLCHLILTQGPPGQLAPLSAQGQPFQHPVDIGDLWKETNCAECHTGALTK